MGKYVILVTLAVAVSLTVLARQGLEMEVETSEKQAQRQEQVLARQIARAAFEMGMSELRRDYENWRPERQDVPYEDGSFDLTANGPSNGPVTLTVVGHYGDESYEITGEAKRQGQASAIFNGITTDGDVDFPQVSGCSGGPCVSGVDAAGGTARHGISLAASASEQDRDDVCDKFHGKVEGRGEGCDVARRTQAQQQWANREMKKLENEIQDLIQQGSNKVTVCEAGGNSSSNSSSSNSSSSSNNNSSSNSSSNSSNSSSSSSSGSNSTCKLRGSTSQSGILYVKGEFEFSGGAQWNGPVYVDDGGSIQINGGGGTRNVNGGLIMEGNTELDMNGGNRIQYNSENILDLQSTMPSLRTKVVTVSDRTGQFARSSE